MSQTITSDHFKVEKLEFVGFVSNHLGFNLYQGFAMINDSYITFGLSVEENISLFSHDYRKHSSNCALCSDVYQPIFELADAFHDELFQLLIHHPAVRLHWMMINPSDYEE